MMGILQKAVLVLIGLVVMFLGLDAGLGGIKTLGWQADPNFVAVSDATVFAAQDSHARFFGGVWFGVGVLFVLGAALPQLRQTLVALCLVIALAGLFRLSQGLSAVLSLAVLPSFLAEILGFSALALWLHKTKHTG